MGTGGSLLPSLLEQGCPLSTQAQHRLACTLHAFSFHFSGQGLAFLSLASELIQTRQIRISWDFR